MTVDILTKLGLLDDQKPANINNNNNNNNNNDNNNKLTTNSNCRVADATTDNGKINMTSSSLGKTSIDLVVNEKKDSLANLKKDSSVRGVGVVILPADWRGVKLDLYDNGFNKKGTSQIKLNCCVIRKEDGKPVYLQASLNSSWDDAVRRGVDPEEWRNSSHWITVKRHRKELSSVYEVRASKIGLKQKAGGTEIVCFLYQDQRLTWCVDIVRAGEIFSFELSQQLTEEQSKTNQIASGYFGPKVTRLIKPQELGI